MKMRRISLSKEVTDFDIKMVREIERFFLTEGGQYYLGQLHLGRENIIDKMKMQRYEEEKVQNIAMLDGWDQATIYYETIKKDMEKKLKMSSAAPQLPGYLEKIGGNSK